MGARSKNLFAICTLFVRLYLHYMNVIIDRPKNSKLSDRIEPFNIGDYDNCFISMKFQVNCFSIFVI